MKLGYFAAIVVLGLIIGIQQYALYTADEVIVLQENLIELLETQLDLKERTIAMQSELCWEGSI